MASFHRDLRRESLRWEGLRDSLDSVILTPTSDRGNWSLFGSGDYSVVSVHAFIDDQLLPSFSTHIRWIQVVPIKDNIFVWRQFMIGFLPFTMTT